MFLYRNCSILLHHRRRRVRCINYYGFITFTQFLSHNNRSVRRIWFWRHSPLIFTGFICFFCGGILSEIVQAALPVESFLYTLFVVLYSNGETQFKHFEWGDILVRLISMILLVTFLTSAIVKSSRI